jgi:hypothetical protein
MSSKAYRHQERRHGGIAAGGRQHTLGGGRHGCIACHSPAAGPHSVGKQMWPGMRRDPDRRVPSRRSGGAEERRSGGAEERRRGEAAKRRIKGEAPIPEGESRAEAQKQAEPRLPRGRPDAPLRMGPTAPIAR